MGKKRSPEAAVRLNFLAQAAELLAGQGGVGKLLAARYGQHSRAVGKKSQVSEVSLTIHTITETESFGRDREYLFSDDGLSAKLIDNHWSA